MYSSIVVSYCSVLRDLINFVLFISVSEMCYNFTSAVYEAFENEKLKNMEWTSNDSVVL